MVKKKQQLRNKRICEHQGLSLKALKKKARKTKSFISESNLRWREFGRADISAAGKTISSVDQQMNSKLFCGAENGRSPKIQMFVVGVAALPTRSSVRSDR